MYGFGEELTKENILKKITSYDIFRYYSENFKDIGKSFCSDLPGRTDENPSAQINVIKNDLLYRDFGAGKSFRAIDYVMVKKNLSYFEALELINQDFNLGLGVYTDRVITPSKVKPVKTSIVLKEKLPTVLKKRQRPFTKKDLEYWNSFYWTEWMLNESNTQSIGNYWIGKNGEVYQFDVKPDELAFTYEYYWHDGRMQRKLYFPERKRNKWFSNADATIVQLVNVAPKTGDIIFITSSKKDAGIFWRLNIDRAFPDLVIHGVSPACESAFVPVEWYNKMKTRWKRIILWYNNDFHKVDNPGVKMSKKFSEKYGIEWYVNPDNTKKDPSDFSKEYGIQEFKNLLESKL